MGGDGDKYRGVTDVVSVLIKSQGGEGSWGGGDQFHCHRISISLQIGHFQSEGGNRRDVDYLIWEVVLVCEL